MGHRDRTLSAIAAPLRLAPLVTAGLVLAARVTANLLRGARAAAGLLRGAPVAAAAVLAAPITAAVLLGAPIAAAVVLAAPATAGAGTVTGRVAWRGTLPSLPDAEVKVDRQVCGDQVPSEALVVGRGGGVRWAVAYLEGVAAPPAEPAEVTLANRRCRFVPHVLAARVGAEIAVVNEDPVLHNLRARLPGPREVFNLVQPTQGQVSRRTIKRAGVIRVTCDAHSTMLGWIVAFEHPFFAVTDGEGRYAIAGVPTGTYRVAIWHERQGQALDTALSREVVVPADGTVTADFTLPDH